ncbi:MAG: S8 family peptidase, partial [Candidatus Aenigmarchaeota archaeon]|nr:S8 family peptidase [Candidatus Aenigmarchaeota archaeon]
MRIAAFVLAVLALSAIASADKIEPSIYLQSGDYVKVIVKADESALPLIASASVEYENFTGGFYSANISRSNLVFLESSAAVKRVWLERKSQPLLDISAPLIGANQTWPYYNGSGVKVCVIDTGMNSSHPALFGRVVAEKDFITDDLDSNSTQDGANHGTHVAGIVASNNSTYKGVAFGSLILNAKVFSNYDGENWSAVDSDVMAGIDWCIAQGAHVLTLSLGGADSNNDGSDALSQKLDYAVDQGKIIIVAAGNSGTSSFSILSPGLSHKAITVGSSQTGKSGTTRNAISGFSSRGPTKDGRIKPDIAAPGEPITSLNNGGGFSTFSGTSMAAPHIAGIAALALQARSNLTPEEFKALLMNTADGREKNNSYGAGVVNVSRLLGKINYTVSSSVGNYSRAHNIFVPENTEEIRATLYCPENYSYHNNL